MKMNEELSEEDAMELIHDFVISLKKNIVKAIIDTRKSNPNIPINPSEVMTMSIHILKEIQSKAKELENKVDKSSSEELH